MVCFPAAHTGGELLVRHDGREVKFNWNGDSQRIQWAAFYSDCEHEVLPVTSGYRVTITYNLYLDHKNRAYQSHNCDFNSLPLYKMLSECLNLEDFFPNGKTSPIQNANVKVESLEHIVIMTMLMQAVLQGNVSGNSKEWMQPFGLSVQIWV